MTAFASRPAGGDGASLGRARHVAVAFHEPGIGGATRAVLRIVPLLEERGWRFSFWVPGEGALGAELRARGYDVSGASRHLRYSLDALRSPPGPGRRLASVPGYLRAFRGWIAARAPDLVHANTRLTIPEALLSRRAGTATLLHVHEMLHPGLRSRAAALLIRRGTDLVVAVSAAAARNLDRQGVSAVVVTNGVDIPTRARPRADRARLIVGTLATVSHRKGTDLFVGAAARLAARDIPLEFRIAGPSAGGPERAWSDSVMARARRDGIEQREVADAFAELAGWDLLVLPSREDPFPLAVLEAMAVGLPVVAAGVDGITEQVTEDTGILVPPDDETALADAIADLARDPERRRRMGETARRRVASHFTLVRQAEAMATAYRCAIERGAARAGAASGARS